MEKLNRVRGWMLVTVAACLAMAPWAAQGAEAPVTLDALKLAPDAAMVTVALPPVNGLVDKAVAYAKNYAPHHVDVNGLLSEAVDQAAWTLGVGEAETFGDVFKAKGFDADAPMALYLDVTAAAKELDKLGAEAAKVDAARAAAEEAKKAARRAERAGEEPPEIPEIPEADLPMSVESLLYELTMPGVAVMMSCVDAEVAEKSLREFLVYEMDVSPSAEEEIEAHGMTIHSFGAEEFSYLFADGKMVGGTSLELVKAVAARMKNPADVRYGSAACPAQACDEIVALVQMDEMMALYADLFAVLTEIEPEAFAALRAQSGLLAEVAKAYEGDDPTVLALTLGDDAVALRAQIDTATHPKLGAFMGAWQPLRLAPCLPEATAVMLSQRFNPETKGLLREYVVDGIPREVVDPQVSMMLPQVMTMIGDEITVGVTDADTGMPQVNVLIGLADAQNTKALLDMLLPVQPGEMHNEVEVKTLAVPLPVEIHLAFCDDVAIVSSDLDSAKAIIDTLKGGQPSALFSSLDPPLDPSVPRQNALVLRMGFVADMVLPLAAMAGGVPPEAMQVLDGVTEVVREVRLMKEMDGTWVQSSMLVLLK